MCFISISKLITMEMNNNYNPNDPAQSGEFENSDVDPGIDPHTDHVIHAREDKREHNIDSNKSISEMREEGLKGADENIGKRNDVAGVLPGISEEEPEKLEDLGEQSEETDALNYKNDRDNGAYNPKNI